MHCELGIYVPHSAEAVPLYMEAFGLTLGYHVLNPDGSYYHSELMQGESQLFSVVESPDAQPGRTAQASMILDSAEAVDHAFAVLSPGAQIEMPPGELPWSPRAAVLTDRFGVWWYISAPQHQPGEDFDPAAF